MMSKFIFAFGNRLLIYDLTLNVTPIMKKIDGAGDVVNMTRDQETNKVLIFTKDC